MKTPEPNSKRTSVRKWVFRALAIVLSLLGAELLLDIAGWISPRFHYYLSTPWSRVVISDNVVVHRMSPYYPGNDAWGFRNPTVPERCEVLAIGDSMTYGFAATPENSWPRQLEKLTGKSTYNMSCGGYGFCQYEVLLDRGLSMRPSTVILGLTIINDFAETYDVVYNQTAHCPAKRFRSEEVTRLNTLRNAESANPFSDFTMIVQKSAETSNVLRRWISSHSSLYALGRQVRSAVVAKEYYSPFREDDPPQDSFELCSQRPHRLSYNDQPELRTVFFDPDFHRRRIDPNDPRIQKGKRISEEILLSMRAKTDKSHARFLVVVLPHKLTVYSEIMARSRRKPPDSYFRYLETEQALTQSIEEFLHAHQIEYVNATRAMRDCLLRSQRPYSESDDGHPNKIGYGAIVEAILPWLESSSR